MVRGGVQSGGMEVRLVSRSLTRSDKICWRELILLHKRWIYGDGTTILQAQTSYGGYLTIQITPVVRRRYSRHRRYQPFFTCEMGNYLKNYWNFRF